MTNRIALAFFALLLVLSTGCVSSAVKDQIATSASHCDVYATVIEETLAGTVPKEDGVPVTEADLASTPDSVKALLQQTINAVYACRRGFHKANFAANDGPDPQTLNLDAVPKIR